MKEPKSIAKTTENPAAPKKAPWKYKSLVKFLIILVVSMVLGALVGGLMSFLSDSSQAMGDTVTAFLASVLPIAQWVFFLLASLAGLALYFLGKGAVGRYEKTGRTDDALNERADHLLGWGMTLCSANQIISYGLFGMVAALPKNPIALIGGLILLLLVIVYCTAYQVKAIAQTKRLYPEKKGDPLDFKFQKDWLSSCDEAERMAIYKAAYKAFCMVNRVLLVLWVATVLCSIFFPLGVVPILLVTILWFTQTISYQYYSMKQEKKKLER